MTIDVSELLAAEPGQMSYEQSRDALTAIVNRLEEGSASLEESLALWEKGEALARRCNEWLDGAEQRLAAATGATSGESPTEPATDTVPTRSADVPF
jgi:exodeoxyribonuclease VII small subunit